MVMVDLTACIHPVKVTGKIHQDHISHRSGWKGLNGLICDTQDDLNFHFLEKNTFV